MFHRHIQRPKGRSFLYKIYTLCLVCCKKQAPNHLLLCSLVATCKGDTDEEFGSHSSMGSMETDRWKSLCFCPLGGIGYCIISLHIFIGKVGGCALFQFLLVVVLGRFAKTISLKIIPLKYTMHG